MTQCCQLAVIDSATVFNVNCQTIFPQDSQEPLSSNFKCADEVDSDWNDGGSDAEEPGATTLCCTLPTMDMAPVPNATSLTLLPQDSKTF